MIEHQTPVWQRLPASNVVCPHRKRKKEPAVSRVLSWTTIHLGQPSPTASSNLPGSPLRRAVRTFARVLPYLVLLQAGFTVPRSVATRAVRSYRTFSPLPAPKCRRYIFCGTFHGLASSRRYLAPCPMEPGLSSGALKAPAIVWPTLTFRTTNYTGVRPTMLTGLCGNRIFAGGQRQLKKSQASAGQGENESLAAPARRTDK